MVASLNRIFPSGDDEEFDDFSLSLSLSFEQSSVPLISPIFPRDRRILDDHYAP